VKIYLPAFGPDLPVHPLTGLTALGLRHNGAPIWPVRGGSGDGDDGNTGGQGGSGSGDGGDGGKDGGGPPGDLGDAGKKALDAMKADRNAARQELKTVKDQLAKLAPLQKLADALGAKPGDDGPTDVDALTTRLAKHEEELATERQARFRAEVAAEKKLTPAQAKRLIGTTREELAKDADELLKDFQPGDRGGGQGGGRTPRQDPSQGARGNQTLTGREQAMAQIEKRFGKKSTAT
jgi:hypothetical protein